MGHRLRVLAALLTLTSRAHTQQAAHRAAISTYLLQSYGAVSKDLMTMLEMMPEPDLGFRPAGIVKEVRSFGEIVAHIAFVSAFSCEMGDGKPPSKRSDDSTLYRDKGRLVALVSETDARCLAYLKTLTDSSLAQVISKPAGTRVMQAVRANSLIFAIAHANEHYGNLVTYIRAMGLVPPAAAAQRAFFSIVAAPPVGAQDRELVQDSSLNNLEHAAGYRTATPGTIGRVLRRGRGPVDVLFIPGWGFGAEVFEPFMAANDASYRMVAVSLPGFGGTSAPPMPPAGTSYGAHTWTRAAVEAIADVIRREKLRRPVIVGHFLIGTQVAMRLALDHPDLVGGLVIVGGEPVRYTPTRRDTTGKTPATFEERVRGADVYWGPRWFKTVTKRTWDANNYAAGQYSRDSVRARELWAQSAAVPLPVMIQYLCEYLASDLTREYANLRVPVRVLMPSFAPGILADPKQAYAQKFFVDAWDGAAQANPIIKVDAVTGAHIFITDDRPDAVRAAIRAIVR